MKRRLAVLLVLAVAGWGACERAATATQGTVLADAAGGNTQIVVALISLAGIVVGAAVTLILGLRKTRGENREQHAGVERALGVLGGKLDVVHSDVRDMRKDFTRHLEDHA